MASSFWRAIGFSRKSKAPKRVASTAVSMVPCPDIITTGMLSCPPACHSLRSEMPSVSGIQMSREPDRAKSLAHPAGRRGVLGEPDVVALVDQDFREQLRIPTSSSTTRMIAMFAFLLLHQGSRMSIRRAAPGIAYIDAPVVFIDDFLDDGQAQSGARALVVT